MSLMRKEIVNSVGLRIEYAKKTLEMISRVSKIISLLLF
jgi:hypothetical protein